MTRVLLPAALLAGCTDTMFEGAVCEPAEMSQPITMDETSTVGVSAETLTEDLGAIVLSVTWTEGPLTGTDTLTLTSDWLDARDLPAGESCADEAGLYVTGTTTLTSTSGAVEAEGVVELWFPAGDPDAFALRTDENELPLAPNSALESAADAAYGDAGTRLWMSAWFAGDNMVGVDASYGGEEVVETGNVQVGTFTRD